mmetsp:Transcript_42484/g.85176  ORF Transcript_42484/g.85176 Transcript_42484/m.85176 type:complete len:123 (-) Transcript_42484:1032-1400(-)
MPTSLRAQPQRAQPHQAQPQRAQPHQGQPHISRRRRDMTVPVAALAAAEAVTARRRYDERESKLVVSIMRCSSALRLSERRAMATPFSAGCVMSCGVSSAMRWHSSGCAAPLERSTPVQRRP